jgi:hypothetical protein
MFRCYPIGTGVVIFCLKESGEQFIINILRLGDNNRIIGYYNLHRESFLSGRNALRPYKSDLDRAEGVSLCLKESGELNYISQ